MILNYHVACLMILLTFGACTTAVETNIQRTDSVQPINGVPYYLPKSLLKLKFIPKDPDDKEDVASIEVSSVNVANNDQRLVASYMASSFAEDRLCISRSPTGLLDKIYFSSEDRTNDILLNVVQLAGALAPDNVASRSILRAAKAGQTLEMLIDPYTDDLKNLNSQLSGSGYVVELVNLPPKPSHFICPQNTICFGTKTTVAVQLRQLAPTSQRLVAKSSSKTKPTKTKNLRQGKQPQVPAGNIVWMSTIEVIDPNYGSLDISRAVMTARLTKLDFDAGVLKSLRVQKGSEALAASELPLKAIERLLAVPGNAIGLAVGNSDEKREYLARRKALQDAGAVPPSTPPAPPSWLFDTDSCVTPPKQVNP
jgi:hypothetical protein